MFKYIISACCAFAFTSVSNLSLAHSSASLEGKSYTVTLGEAGKTGDPDTLIFSHGKFTSTACIQWGFSPNPFSVKQNKDEVTFSSKGKSEAEGNTAWSGSVSGTKISGTMTWSKKGQTPIVYQFKGSEQKKPHVKEVYSIKMTGTDKSTMTDTLLFESGKMISSGCVQYGFGATQFTKKTQGSNWSFVSNASSKKEGINAWTGTIANGKISGKLVWSKKGQKDLVYNFEGENIRK